MKSLLCLARAKAGKFDTKGKIEQMTDIIKRLKVWTNAKILDIFFFGLFPISQLAGCLILFLSSVYMSYSSSM
ncbi:hypothetical protein Bca52824_003498 [Brassica carinata]|uniref:Uncharacterized protein n=1 Tax=Brassica carinata TaxID=52824 RepID=A0A8X8BFA5_BRACI|nr:hypothetical protein Bca52824_003498 [Brassica carinata]